MTAEGWLVLEVLHKAGCQLYVRRGGRLDWALPPNINQAAANKMIQKYKPLLIELISEEKSARKIERLNRRWLAEKEKSYEYRFAKSVVGSASDTC